MLGVEIVIVELHGGLHEDGLNEQDPPPGTPEHEKVTGWLVPLTKARLKLIVVEPPAVTGIIAPVDGLEKTE